MTKILHIYPSSNAMIARYVDMVEKGMPESVTSASAVDEKDARQKCKEWKPDIVHLHGLQQPDLLQAANYAMKQGARLVVNPHGDLQPWVMGSSVKQGLAQRSMRSTIEHAYALIAQSKMEAENLRQLEWNDRIETITNPLITRTTSITQLTTMTATIYNKVMASDVLALMDDNTRRALSLLIKAGITGDERWLDGRINEAPDWQKLYVYAEQEGIADVVDHGIGVLNLMAPTPQHSPIYLPNGYEKPKPAACKTITELVKLMKEEVEEQNLSMLRLVELHMQLRRDDTDEELLLTELEEAKLQSFFASLLQVLSELTGLEEGFMPCDPQDNGDTKRIRITITNHLKI